MRDPEREKDGLRGSRSCGPASESGSRDGGKWGKDENGDRQTRREKMEIACVGQIDIFCERDVT